MKKIRENALRLDKEVISSLSENELSGVRGGEANSIQILGGGVPSNELGLNSRNLPVPHV